MTRFGIMQGRLSAAGPRPQSFPWATWREEFAAARACGFDGLEWLLTGDRFDENPLWTSADRIRRCGFESGVPVASICADCFIEWPTSIELLTRIVDAAASIGADTIVVPWLAAGACSADDFRRRMRVLVPAVDRAADRGVRIAIECDLPAAVLVALVDEGSRSNLGICFDTGNAAALGRDPASELRTLAHRVLAVHIKDRVRGGGSVPLGHGEVSFAPLADAIAALDYRAPLILETPRQADPLASARDQLAFLRRYLTAASPS